MVADGLETGKTKKPRKKRRGRKPASKGMGKVVAVQESTMKAIGELFLSINQQLRQIATSVGAKKTGEHQDDDEKESDEDNEKPARQQWILVSKGKPGSQVLPLYYAGSVEDETEGGIQLLHNWVSGLLIEAAFRFPSQLVANQVAQRVGRADLGHIPAYATRFFTGDDKDSDDDEEEDSDKEEETKKAAWVIMAEVDEDRWDEDDEECKPLYLAQDRRSKRSTPWWRWTTLLPEAIALSDAKQAADLWRKLKKKVSPPNHRYYKPPEVVYVDLP